MPASRWLTVLVVVLGVLVLPPAVGGQTIKYSNIKPLHTLDGKVIYDRECAVCHGPLGRGDGRAVKALAYGVPDLSCIAARDGRFDVLHVVHHITDPKTDRDHMFDWGHGLGKAFHNDQGAAQVAALNLARHIESLQRPAER